MLKFGENGKFSMLLFGDIHEKEDWKTNPKFKDMNKLMNAALDEFRPDICVLLGDNLSTGLLKDRKEVFDEALAAICRPAVERGIPVYSIMGNHEHDPEIDGEVLAAYARAEGVTMRSESPGGNADYKEIVYSSDGKTPLACLWFLDSNNLYEDRSVSHYDVVHTDQIEWFEKESAELKEMNGGEPMPSYIFQHTPVPEEYRLLRKARFWELPVSVKGHNTLEKNRYVGVKGVKGYVGEGPCSPDINNGQFDSWKKTGGVKAAFFGHDHLNDFSGYVDGIYLAQHKTAGFRAYTDGCRSCVRYVEIDEKSPGEFTDVLKHFKEFGLECECLGPVLKRITDRQSMLMHIAFGVLGAAAAIAAVAGIAIHFLG